MPVAYDFCSAHIDDAVRAAGRTAFAEALAAGLTVFYLESAEPQDTGGRDPLLRTIRAGPRQEFLDNRFAQRHTRHVIDRIMYPCPDAGISGLLAHSTDEFGSLRKEMSQHLRSGGRER